jgi:serine/threonine protein kinase
MRKLTYFILYYIYSISILASDTSDSDSEGTPPAPTMQKFYQSSEEDESEKPCAFSDKKIIQRNDFAQVTFDPEKGTVVKTYKNPREEGKQRGHTALRTKEYKFVVPFELKYGISGRIKEVSSPHMGEDLFELRKKDSRFNDINFIKILFVKTAKELKKYHLESIYHRDLKPENLVLGPDDILKIIDYDTVILCEEEKVDKRPRSNTIGEMTREYSSPEVVELKEKFPGYKKSKKKYDYDVIAQDLWQLGATFCYLMTYEYAINYTNKTNSIFEIQQILINLAQSKSKYELSNDLINFCGTVAMLLNYEPEQRASLDTVIQKCEKEERQNKFLSFLKSFSNT